MAISPQNPARVHGHHALLSPASSNDTRSLERDFGKQESPAELHALIDVLGNVRQRILTNTFFRGSAKWLSWVLIGLIAVAAVSMRMAGAMALAAVLVVCGIALILTWIWRTRISIYDAACRLDSAAGLRDRLSTTIFLADVKNPDEMMQRQRQDALARLEKVTPTGLFPLRMPATASHALVLFLATAGLLAYRINHKAPLVALLQSTARSQLVQSILSPIAHAMEKDLQRTISLVKSPEPAADEVRAGETTPPPDNLWQNGDDKQYDQQNGQQDAPEANLDSENQDQQPAAGNQNGSESADSQQQSGQQSQQSQDASNSASKPGQQQESKEDQSNSPSLGQSLMQALKNMMNPQNSQSNNKGNQDSQQSNSQGAPQAGNANSSNENENGQKGDSRGSSDQPQKPSQSASNGAGTQKGIKQTRTDFDSHQVTAVPDRVALESTHYKEDVRMRANTETGTSQMITHNVSSQSEAVVNGAEQENIPARYRLYVQRYFEHTESALPDNGQQDNGQQESGQSQSEQQQNVQQ